MREINKKYKKVINHIARLTLCKTNNSCSHLFFNLNIFVDGNSIAKAFFHHYLFAYDNLHVRSDCMRKVRLIIVFLIVGLLASCTSPNDSSNPRDETIPHEDLIELTLEELSYYDGKEGRPAYVAVNGMIYDVTNSLFWQSGSHNGYSAGRDLTDAIINQSPHGLSTLTQVPIVGILVESKD